MLTLFLAFSVLSPVKLPGEEKDPAGLRFNAQLLGGENSYRDGEGNLSAFGYYLALFKLDLPEERARARFSLEVNTPRPGRSRVLPSLEAEYRNAYFSLGRRFLPGPPSDFLGLVEGRVGLAGVPPARRTNSLFFAPWRPFPGIFWLGEKGSEDKKKNRPGWFISDPEGRLLLAWRPSDGSGVFALRREQRTARNKSLVSVDLTRDGRGQAPYGRAVLHRRERKGSGEPDSRLEFEAERKPEWDATRDENGETTLRRGKSGAAYAGASRPISLLQSALSLEAGGIDRGAWAARLLGMELQIPAFSRLLRLRLRLRAYQVRTYGSSGPGGDERPIRVPGLGAGILLGDEKTHMYLLYERRSRPGGEFGFSIRKKGLFFSLGAAFRAGAFAAARGGRNDRDKRSQTEFLFLRLPGTDETSFYFYRRETVALRLRLKTKFLNFSLSGTESREGRAYAASFAGRLIF